MARPKAESADRRNEPLSPLEGPPSFRTLPEQIATKIRQAILAGRLQPGSRLVETTIAAEMRTSRGPVRDALGLLEGEGLVVRLPHRGACVLDFCQQRLREVAGLRAVLEEFAVSQAVPRLTREHLARLDSLVRGMEAAARRRALGEFNDLDYQFHDAILDSSGNRTLHETWRGMQRRIRAFLASTNLANDDLQAIAGWHRGILEALASRSVTKVRRAMRAHATQVEEELNLLLAPPTAAAVNPAVRRTGGRKRG